VRLQHIGREDEGDADTQDTTKGLPKLKVRLGPNAVKMVRQHRILGLIIDDRLNWKVHLKNVNARADKKLGILKTLAHKKWGGDQKTLLRIHQMIVLSTLRYRESIYGTATKPALKTLEPIHNKGVKLALGVFTICKTKNALCEAGFPTLTEIRELNTTFVATRILMNERHPITLLHQPQNTR
jgi:hypothetical protein